ncbi:hypothetical protein Poli38472_002752 [Pythium oligandrum]|uniref:Protein kinase domain-containing protein n=1 Tax=Pythium oligandrum TaxID=41045 RepID=A0A8K1FIG8_PYTOL|nr:hypothetical protein Poli38472_002752 [Pythium oligandrum]|eukprot:TMW63811.1 hypothetical protein Poli38472_002752 [Pythium oligandrum]
MTRIQDYELQEFLGEGSTAHVYLATHTSSQERVALKVIDKLLIRHAKLESRVRREMTLHAPLSHPQIVQVLDVFEDQQNHYMALEYCTERSVADLVRSLRTTQSRLDEALAKKIFRQTVMGVAYLHEQGIIHRDLKLANLLLTSDLEVKISDFGLATRMADEHGTVCGTPNFIAPEVLTAVDGGEYDQAVDIWSLGCILYTLLLGTPPFEGKRVSDTLANISQAAFKPLEFPQGFSATAADLIKRMLNSDPSSRPTAAQILVHPWVKSPAASSAKPLKPHPRQRVTRSKPKTHRSDVTQAARRPPSSQLPQPNGSDSDAADDSEDECESSQDPSDASGREQYDLPSISDDSDEEDDEGDDYDEDFSLSELSISGIFDETEDEKSDNVIVTEEPDASDTKEEAAVTMAPPEEKTVSSNAQPEFVRELHALSLRLSVLDLSFLGVEDDPVDVVWDCWETSDIRELQRCTLSVSNGLTGEYLLSAGELHGTRTNGTPFSFECGKSAIPGTTRSASDVDDEVDEVRALMRFVHCLLARSLQLRRANMVSDIDALPLIHYDTLPDSLLASLRRPSLRRSLRRHLSEIPDANKYIDKASDTVVAVRTLPGVGIGRLEQDGRLTIAFFEGSMLQLNATGSLLVYRPTPTDREDMFDLAESPFLPTAVKQRFEHVPTFVRQMKMAQ